MTRITLQTLATAPEESKTYLENARRSSGFIPNLLLALSNSPQALQTYITVGAINNNNSLSAAERETVQLIAATVHGCGFAWRDTAQRSKRKRSCLRPIYRRYASGSRCQTRILKPLPASHAKSSPRAARLARRHGRGFARRVTASARRWM